MGNYVDIPILGGSSTPTYVDYDNGNSGSGTVTINWANGNVQRLTLTGNCTITHSGGTAGQECVLYLCQDGTGTRTVIWSNTQWGSSTPTLTTTARRVDCFRFVDVAPGYLPLSQSLNRPDARYPFSPNQISGLALWLDAAMGVTVDGSNNVGAWLDQSSNAYNFTQSTGANKPLLVASQLNSLPVIRFTKASSTYVSIASTLSLANLTGFAWYIVMKHRGFSGSPDYQAPMSSGITGVATEAFWPLFSTDASYSDIAIGSPTALTRFKSGSLPLDTTTFHVLKFAYNGSGAGTGTNYTIAQDSTSPTLAAAGSFSSNAGAHRIGMRADGAQAFNADIAAIYAYTQNVSTADDANLRSYINARFGI